MYQQKSIGTEPSPLLVSDLVMEHDHPILGVLMVHGGHIERERDRE